MKIKTPNAALVWKQVDDFVVPRLRLNVIDRAVYSHLLRHTRLEGRHRLSFTQMWLAKGIGVCRNTARSSMRRLANRGAIRLIESSLGGHLVGRLARALAGDYEPVAQGALGHVEEGLRGDLLGVDHLLGGHHQRDPLDGEGLPAGGRPLGEPGQRAREQSRGADDIDGCRQLSLAGHPERGEWRREERRR